jgi:hypothetical protein
VVEVSKKSPDENSRFGVFYVLRGTGSVNCFLFFLIFVFFLHSVFLFWIEKLIVRKTVT